MQFSTTTLVLAASLLTADARPVQRGITEPHLQPISREQQQRIRDLDPPVMLDGRYHAQNNRIQRACPPALVPRVFPADKFASSAVDAYCSTMLAPSTTWKTVTLIPTAYVIRGQVVTAQATEPTPDPLAAIDYHVRRMDRFQVTSACNCLIDQGEVPAVVTRTKTVTGAVKTIVPGTRARVHEGL